MFNHSLDQNVDRHVYLNWFLLSLSGGFINAGGFLATGRFVSHVTGFATLFGVDLAKVQFQDAFGILSVPVFFLIGSFIAGILIDHPRHLGHKPRFDWVMGISSACLILAATGGELSIFGTFGETFKLEQSYILLVLLCLSCGLQNAAITSSSGKSVRTTHLTGLTTDLGLGLARLFSLGLTHNLSHKEIRANFLRAGSIASFIIGSVLGAGVFLSFGYKGFLFPAAISIYAAWHGYTKHKNLTS